MNKFFPITLMMTLTVFHLLTSPALAQLDWIKSRLKSLGSENIESLKSASLGQTRVGEGLKEALKVGIKNAVESVGRTDGFFANDEIKLLLPDKLRRLDQGLRMIGMNEQLDAFILGMNRAAEAAAPQAQDIFLDSLFEMSFDDAVKIYQAGDTAATDYFRDKAYDRLFAAFKPTVERTLSNYDVTSQYKSLMAKYKAIPFSKKLPAPSIDDYVVHKSLDGLFHVLAQEETKIRNNPAARVTDVLKEVFGQ